MKITTININKLSIDIYMMSKKNRENIYYGSSVIFDSKEAMEDYIKKSGQVGISDSITFADAYDEWEYEPGMEWCELSETYYKEDTDYFFSPLIVDKFEEYEYILRYENEIDGKIFEYVIISNKDISSFSAKKIKKIFAGEINQFVYLITSG